MAALKTVTAGARSGLVGASDAIRAVLAKLEAFSTCDAPVLIDGETGTGKELAARALHYQSRRRGEPFVPINCAALPEQLIVNELFGHHRGAFTGAEVRQAGLVEQAGGGTILFDEVDMLPLPAQAVLLRFLQDQEYRPLGGGVVKIGDVRIVAASNARLATKVKDRSFREDLFYRLGVLMLHLPPLRERRDDVPLLADHFLQRLQQRYGGAKRLDPQALDTLEAHDWPGNVRELENRLHRAFVLSPGPEIGCAELELEPTAAPARLRTVANGCDVFAAAKVRAIADFEHDYLSRLMAMTRGNISAASRVAHKERRTLARLLQKHGINRREYQGEGGMSDA
ncbi:sigma-54 dependent transcriptional regulator [Sphingomonas sp. BIUV-7]|uniref:Sigma-54 dependent transcriptional regulator n=1 Tax=Sphingomonas natans TaxID=3063330 RepID=A0ABT8YEX3_9SPHN|nr:sigma-54 dependent transcriptional regulator [Sphingomonas sp. BIUV-7]MDO6416130.1 sigma-54 dependent transcriptional regulator [Sphingomonas sp. BIUV-7]